MSASAKKSTLCFAYLKLWHLDSYYVDPDRAVVLYKVFTSPKLRSSGQAPLVWTDETGPLFLKPHHGAVHFIRGPRIDADRCDVYTDGNVWLRDFDEETSLSLRFDRVPESKATDQIVRCEIRTADFWLVYYFDNFEAFMPEPTHSCLQATNVGASEWAELRRQVADESLRPCIDDAELDESFVSYYQNCVVAGNVYWLTTAALDDLIKTLRPVAGFDDRSFYIDRTHVEYVRAGRRLVLARFTKICYLCRFRFRLEIGFETSPRHLNSYTLEELVTHYCRYHNATLRSDNSVFMPWRCLND